MKLTTNLFGEIIITISKAEIDSLMNSKPNETKYAKPKLPSMHQKSFDFLQEVKNVYGSSKIRRRDIKLRQLANKYNLIDLTQLLFRLRKADCIDVNWVDEKQNRIDTFVIKY